MLQLPLLSGKTGELIYIERDISREKNQPLERKGEAKRKKKKRVVKANLKSMVDKPIRKRESNQKVQESKKKKEQKDRFS